MRTHKFIIVLLSLFCLTACAEGKLQKKYVIGFYNVENLFDTVHDQGKDDGQFLPDGSYNWTQDKYRIKLHNISRVIREMSVENGRYNTILGLAEVENAGVLDDLVKCREIADAGYRYIHYESPDVRGIDVALLYIPSEFKPLESRAIKFDYNGTDIKFEKTPKQLSEFATRDILMVRGKLKGEMFAFFVAHFPSRIGDKGSDLRSRCAEQIYQESEKLQQSWPGIKIVVMGDMNDNPADESMVRYLHSRQTIEEMEATDFFSPFMQMHLDGFGTEEYRGEWNIFDIILVNSALASRSGSGFKILKSDDVHYGYVFKRDFLTQHSGQYKGTPFRTFSYNEFIKGYSDHYPTYIVISK